jgi:hypothetical protein
METSSREASVRYSGEQTYLLRDTDASSVLSQPARLSNIMTWVLVWFALTYVVFFIIVYTLMIVVGINSLGEDSSQTIVSWLIRFGILGIDCCGLDSAIN